MSNQHFWQLSLSGALSNCNLRQIRQRQGIESRPWPSLSALSRDVLPTSCLKNFPLFSLFSSTNMLRKLGGSKTFPFTLFSSKLEKLLSQSETELNKLLIFGIFLWGVACHPPKSTLGEGEENEIFEEHFYQNFDLSLDGSESFWMNLSWNCSVQRDLGHLTASKASANRYSFFQCQ